MPALLANEGAWIAIGVSLFFLIAGVVMHRVIVNILKRPAPPPRGPHDPPDTDD